MRVFRRIMRKTDVDVLVLNPVDDIEIKKKIIDVLKESEEPLSMKEIMEKLHEQDVYIGLFRLSKIVRELINEGSVMVVKKGRGVRYFVPVR